MVRTTALGKRRSTHLEQAMARDIPLEAMIEKEPVTVIMSERGWIKAMKGHGDLSKPDLSKFKEGDGPAYAFHAQTTDKLVFACDDGRFYTLGADKLPGARGFGEPVRSMIDLDTETQIVSLLPYNENGRLLLVASSGRGFQAAMSDIIAETRKGRQVVNLKPRHQACRRACHCRRCRSCRGCGREPQACSLPDNRIA